MADSDDEDFVVIGNPLPQYDEDEVPKKPVHIQQQKVTDSKGRQRFHGAFTGGFSAGYFNTVGSKEGWAPSTFVSARTKAAEDEESNEQRPEDFMDEEDFDEHGIAPKQVSVASDFKERERKRKTAEHSHGIIPGEAPLQNLIVPSSIPMGIQLLRKLGWKEGQGVGPRVQRKSRRQKKTVAGKKIYGCALPPANENESSSSDTEFAPENVTFAPKDINPIRFKPKNDFHGLGYSGISVPTGFGSSSSGHINLFEPMAVTKKPAVSSSGRRGMTGAAFGVGALEDDDDDVYAVDSMSNYDRVLSDNSDKNFGWTAPKHRGMSSAPVGYLGKVLEGFKLSTNTLKPKETFAPPQLPRNYKPQRHKENSQNNVNQTRSAPVSNTHNKITSKKLDAKVRSAMLGEIGSVFDLVSDRDKQRMQSVKSAEPTPSTPQPSTSTSHIPMPSRQSPATPKISVEEQRKQGMALNKFGGGFKPFAKDPAKQNRYDQFLELKNKGIKYEPDAVGMTEWQIQKEKEDFARAAILYRPMANMMASRFTTAKFADDEKNVEIAPEKSDDRKKAVEMKMFGKLTREQHEWHPDKVLCKRFNIANPYPGSSIVGVPGGAKRSNFASYDFVEENRIEPPEENMETEEPVAEKDTIRADIKPLAILANSDTGLQSVAAPPSAHRDNNVETPGVSTSDQQPDVDLTIDNAPEVKTEPTERPPMDIFKAIFSNSEGSSDSDEEDEEPRAANENQSKVIQPNLSTSVIPRKESLIQGQSLSSPNMESTIKVESLEDRLSPPFPGEDRQDDVIVESATTESVEDLYGPAKPPPSNDIGDGAFSSGGKRKLKQKKEKHKDKKKKSKHKKQKAKDKKKKEKKKKKDKKKVTITVSSSSSGSEADEDTDSEPDNQPSDNQLLNKLKHHPKLGRMTAADFM